MRKKEIRIGSYLLALSVEKTKENYALLPSFDKEDMGLAFFHHILEKGEEKSLLFLESLGIDRKKLSLVRPVAEPDEEGKVLYLCAAPLCGKVLEGGDVIPRQSEEIEGISVVFVKERESFSPGLPIFSEEMIEMRFVIYLPFDSDFFNEE